MGGSWKWVGGWLTKSVKQALYAISTDRIFIDETLRTHLCEVESILNKSSHTPISDDIHNFEAIAPNHLLISYQNNENSFANLTHYIKGLQNHFKTMQSCANMFWNCCGNYYLPIINNHTKWINSEIYLSKNDLIIIKSKDVPRSHWPLGRILDINPCTDGVACSVIIKTPYKKLIRPSRSIVFLKNSVTNTLLWDKTFFHVQGGGCSDKNCLPCMWKPAG